MENVQTWRDALREATNISGWECSVNSNYIFEGLIRF